MFLKNEVGYKNRIIYVRLSLTYSIADQVAGFYISGSLALNWLAITVYLNNSTTYKLHNLYKMLNIIQSQGTLPFKNVNFDI